MGGETSKVVGPPTKEQCEELASRTNFTATEVSALYKHFIKISQSLTPDGLIDIQEFRAVLGVQDSPFINRVFAAFDQDGDANVDFVEFVLGLSALSPVATIEEKAAFCFKIYDIDGNGQIEKPELTEVLSYSLGTNSAVKIPEQQLQRIIDATFRAMDTNGDGMISFEEFKEQALRNQSILNCVTLDVSRLTRS